jgi:hypothetical protein
MLFIVSWPKKRRKVFETYAQRNGFDPLDPNSWYTQSRKRILASTVIKYKNIYNIKM